MKHSILISTQENRKLAAAFKQDATDERCHTSNVLQEKKSSLMISFTLQVDISGANKKSGTHRFNPHHKKLL